MFIQRIIKEKQEELNSTFWNIAFCRIKFHRGVEFNFASEVVKKLVKKLSKKFQKPVDKLHLLIYNITWTFGKGVHLLNG